jgi:hypothetical protein
MARHDFPYSDAQASDAEARGLNDDLIQPSLRRAFPLPAEDHGNDHRFRVLLDALARASDRNR